MQRCKDVAVIDWHRAGVMLSAYTRRWVRVASCTPAKVRLPRKHSVEESYPQALEQHVFHCNSRVPFRIARDCTRHVVEESLQEACSLSLALRPISMKTCERAVSRLGKSAHDAFRRGNRPLSWTGVQRRSFRDTGHLVFYASAAKRQKKTVSRLSAQADRLKALSGQLRNGSEQPGHLAAVVSELVELNAALSEVRYRLLPPPPPPRRGASVLLRGGSVVHLLSTRRGTDESGCFRAGLRRQQQ